MEENESQNLIVFFVDTLYNVYVLNCPCVRCCLVESGVVMAELNFNLNDKFFSLDELKVDLHIRDSRTLQQAMKEK